MLGRLFVRQPARNRGLDRRNKRVYVHAMQKNRSVSRARCDALTECTDRERAVSLRHGAKGGVALQLGRPRNLLKSKPASDTE